jgi:prickle
VIPTTSKKEVRFEGDFQDTLPRSRSYTGKSSSRNSGRRRKGSRQRKSSSHHHHNESSGKHRSSRNSRHLSSSHNDEPSTSAQARLIDSHNRIQRDSDDETETTQSICSTCSSSSSDSDDFAYELPQRQVYGGVRVNYVPNDALAVACARKEQFNNSNQSGNSDRDKNCTIS